jgi:predicted DNA-binding protein
MTMRTKDEHIGLRLPTNLKKELQELGKREGRTLSQICEMFLCGGLENYEKEGSRYLQRLISQQKKKHTAD